MRGLARTLLAALAIALSSAVGWAQAASEFAELIGQTQTKIERGLAEYESFLKETQAEKLELVSEINRLENLLLDLRRESSRTERVNAEREQDLADLNERIRSLNSQVEYSSGILSEYLTNFESRIDFSEDQQYSDSLRDIRQGLDSAGNEPQTRLPLYFQALDLGLERQEQLIGGKRFSGRAITGAGGVKEGSILIVGPAAYFASNDQQAAGALSFNSGTIEPGLSPVPPASAAAIAQVVQSGQGQLPMDSSLGKALELERAEGTLLQHIQKGGWVGYTILLLGALAIVVGLVKAVDLQGSKVKTPDNLNDIARDAVSADPEPARRSARSLPSPIASLLETGIDFAKTDTDTILDSMDAYIMRIQPRWERFLPFLATTAAVAPLLGLLGTVVGMIKTFTLIEVFGTGDAKSLSSGISEALITTELGLIVAIPALILHGIFSRVLRSRVGTMQQVAADFARHATAAKTP